MLIWLISDFTFLFVEYFLWKAIFEANNGVLYNFTLKQYITYVAMGLIVARITACRLDFDVAGEIKDGSIVMNLIKPFNYAGMWFSRHVGWFIGGSATLIPVMIVIALLIGFNPVAMPVAAAFALSLIFGFIISFFFTMIMGMLAFWLTNIWGLLLFKGNLIAIFSGQMIAISLFFKIGESGIENFPLPFVSQEFIQGLFKTLGYVSYMLPFQAMTYTPTAIYCLCPQ
jgi:ABC-2 type transport system permease protein